MVTARDRRGEELGRRGVGAQRGQGGSQGRHAQGRQGVEQLPEAV